MSKLARFICTALMLLAALAAYAMLHGCGGTSAVVKAENAAIASAYGLSLDQCKAVGKASGSFAVFEACERAETRRLCVAEPKLRTAWVRCAEVGVMP